MLRGGHFEINDAAIRWFASPNICAQLHVRIAPEEGKNARENRRIPGFVTSRSKSRAQTKIARR
jgi:ribosomal protein L39E